LSPQTNMNYGLEYNSQAVLNLHEDEDGKPEFTSLGEENQKINRGCCDSRLLILKVKSLSVFTGLASKDTISIIYGILFS